MVLTVSMCVDTVLRPNSASIQTEARFNGCIEGYRVEICSESRGLVFRMLYEFIAITFKLYKLPLHLSK